MPLNPDSILAPMYGGVSIVLPIDDDDSQSVTVKIPVILVFF